MAKLLRSVAFGACLTLGTTVSPASAGPSQDNAPVVVAATAKSGQAQADVQQAGKDEADGSETADLRRGFFWDRGIRLATNRLKLHIAGIVENDSTAFVGVTSELEERVGPINNGVAWRRARVFLRGTVYERFDFNLEYDFAANSPPSLKNAYVGMRFDALVLGDWRIDAGRFQTPLSLEGHTHNTDTTFMERASLSVFFPDRNTGVLLQGNISKLSSKFHWNVGFTFPEDELGASHNEKASPSGRFRYAFNPRGGDVLIHAGFDYLQRNVDPNNQIMRAAARPESHLAPIFVDTGDIAASGGDIANLEVAAAKGPLSVQGEYATIRARSTDDQGDLNFSAFYVYVSYVLTGEMRPYDETRGSFARIAPAEEFTGSEGGRGAFEVAFRFSRIDLTDKQVDGGIMDNVTAALNWYAGHHARVSTNVIRSKVDGLEPVWILQARLQWAY